MISEKCLVIFLFVINVIFLSLSCVLLVFEVQNFINPEDKSSKLRAATRPANKVLDISGIVIGSFKIVISIYGLAGALLKNRYILYSFILLLVLDFLCRILLIMFLSFSITGVGKFLGRGVLVEAEEGVKQVFASYGDTVRSPGIEITKEVDEFMKNNPCCIWSTDATTNHFTRTQWYEIENPDVKWKQKDYVPQTLPASCCTSRVIQTGNSDSCIRATDITTAQNQDFVRSENCLKLYMKGKFIFIYCMIAAHSITIILNALSIVAAYFIASGKVRYAYEEDDGGDSTHSSDYY